MAFPTNLVPDFDLMVSAARADGWSRAFGIGYNPNIDSGTVPESCWGGSGPYPWITAAAGNNLEVVAPGSTQDVNLTGTGAWTVIVQGLEPITLNPISDTVALNAATPVPLPRPYYRINAMRVTTANRTPGVGTGKNSVDILLRDSGGGTTRAVILAGKGTARQAAFTVPTGFTLEVPEILLVVDNATGAAARKASIETYFAGPAASNGAIILPLPINNTNLSPYNHIVHPPIAVAQQNDFDLPVNNVSDNATIITAAWNGVLKRNTL